MARAGYLESARAMALGAPPLAYFCAATWPVLSPPLTRGRIGGRPPALTAAQRDEVRRMRDEEHRAVSEIARLFKVSERTVRRA